LSHIKEADDVEEEKGRNGTDEMKKGEGFIAPGCKLGL